MKKSIVAKTKEWKMRRKYDFSDSRPNKYAPKYAEGIEIVIIRKKDSYGMTALQLKSIIETEEQNP